MNLLLSSPWEELEPGARFATRGRTVTESDVAAFAGLTGDRHPLHTDAEWARDSEWGERIAHGLLVVSFAAGLVPLDPERVVALRAVREAVFKSPVRLGQTIRVEGTVAEVRPVAHGLALVALTCRVRTEDGALACRMVLEVLWSGDSVGAAEAEDLAAGFVPLPL